MQSNRRRKRGEKKMKEKKIKKKNKGMAHAKQ